MKSLDELINLDEPGIKNVERWVAASEHPCEILPPGPNRADVLLKTQITTRSTLGAIIYETGGILIDGGWLRFLGSGHSKLTRSVPAWNETRASGFLLVADDAAGGFFAINGGAFGKDIQTMYYWAPDDLDWISLDIGYTEFFSAMLTARLAHFYKNLRWKGWREDVESLSGDRCYFFFPFLWTKEGSVHSTRTGTVPVSEAFDAKADIVRQLGNGAQS